MEKELRYKTYKTMKALMNDMVLKQELELVLVTKELQVTHTPENRQIERFEIANILVKTDKGIYYKIQMQKDRSDICSYKTEQQFIVKEVDSLDIRMIGGWKRMNRYGNKEMAFYDYYRPKGKGKNRIKISQDSSDTLGCEEYFTIEVSKTGIWMKAKNKMTTQYKRRKMKVEDLENMAEERGLECDYLNNFVL